MNCPTRDPEPTGTLLAFQTLLLSADSRPSGNPTFNQNPPTYDRTLVPRNSAVCGGGRLSEDEYNMGLHVMAVFVVLTQSSLGNIPLPHPPVHGYSLIGAPVTQHARSP